MKMTPDWTASYNNINIDLNTPSNTDADCRTSEELGIPDGIASWAGCWRRVIGAIKVILIESKLNQIYIMMCSWYTITG